jgi:hypothetical protein
MLSNNFISVSKEPSHWIVSQNFIRPDKGLYKPQVHLFRLRSDGFWQVPCDQPDVAFSKRSLQTNWITPLITMTILAAFDGKDFVISGSVFVKYAPGGYQLDEGYCVGKSKRIP